MMTDNTKKTTKAYSVKELYSQNSSEPDETEGEVWNSGLEVLENPRVIVPEEVRKICVSLQNSVNRNEFGVLFKGEWTEDGFKVYADYVVPEQDVSRAHITYEEDLKKYRDEGYIVNVHSHPFSGRNSRFSGTDDDHINSHFDVALLYGGNAEDIVHGIANIEIKPGLMVQIEPEIELNEPEPVLPDVDTENISMPSKNRVKTTPKTYGRTTSFDWSEYKKQFKNSEDDEKQGVKYGYSY